MKEKRYFCERISAINLWKVIEIFFIIITVIVSIVLYNFDTEYDENEGEHSEKVYANLEEIADGVISENVINLDTMPDSVSNYEVTYENGVLTFKCSMDHYEGKRLHPLPSIIVTESSGVVKKERNVSSKEEYIKRYKGFTIVDDVCKGMIIGVVGATALLAVSFILYGISRIHKKIDTKKKPS